MNKSDLIQKAAERLRLDIPTMKKCVDTFFDEMTHALVRGETVEIRDFGTFSVREQEAFECTCPATQERIEVPARKHPRWRTAKDMKRRINK